MPKLPRLLVLTLFLLSFSAMADDREEKSYLLYNHGSFQLNIPKSWQSKIKQPPNNLPPTIIFTPQSGHLFQVLVTPMWAVRPGMMLPGPEGIKNNVAQVSEKIKPGAEENELEIKMLNGPSVKGYYFSATDKAPKPDEFKYMTQGMFRLGELLVTFTALTNDGAVDIVKETIGIMENAKHVKGKLSSSAENARTVNNQSIQISEHNNIYSLTVPVSKLVMSIPKGRFSQNISSRSGSSNGPRYFRFDDSTNHIIVSGWFEPARGFLGVKKFWENETYEWKKNGLPNPIKVMFKKTRQWDTIVYDTKIQGITNSHIRAHCLQGGTWIDVHLSISSKITSKNARLKLESILKSISVKEKI